MADAYTPNTANGQIFARAELDLIAAADAALEARLATLEARPAPAYCGMRQDVGESDSVTLAAGVPLELVTCWDTISANQGITGSLGAGTLTIANDGIYLFDAVVGLENGDATDEYTLKVLVDDVFYPTPPSSPAKNETSATLDILSMPNSLTAGTEISLALESTNARTLDIVRAVMRLFRVG